jgi:hypothetical protein
MAAMPFAALSIFKTDIVVNEIDIEMGSLSVERQILRA